MTDTLTLDALVEEVKAALVASGWAAGPRHADGAARAALAAVAKAAGKGALQSGEHLTSTYADVLADESTEAHDAARVATLLRTLAEAAP